MPPQAGEQSAGRVGGNIPDIADGPRKNPWPDNLGDDTPDEEMERDFAGFGKTVVRPQSEAPLQPEQDRQRAGNQQQVVKLPGEERRGADVTPPAAIKGIEQACAQPRGIGEILKPFHSSATIRKPAAPASRSLNSHRFIDGEDGCLPCRHKEPIAKSVAQG